MKASSASHIDEVIARTSKRLGGTFADDDLITRSWTRCVTDHGLDPTRAQPARVIEHWQLREHQEQIESFLRVARAGMERPYGAQHSTSRAFLCNGDTAATDADPAGAASRTGSGAARVPGVGSPQRR